MKSIRHFWAPKPGAASLATEMNALGGPTNFHRLWVKFSATPPRTKSILLEWHTLCDTDFEKLFDTMSWFAKMFAGEMPDFRTLVSVAMRIFFFFFFHQQQSRQLHHITFPCLWTEDFLVSKAPGLRIVSFRSSLSLVTIPRQWDKSTHIFSWPLFWTLLAATDITRIYHAASSGLQDIDISPAICQSVKCIRLWLVATLISRHRKTSRKKSTHEFVPSKTIMQGYLFQFPL